MSYIMIHAGFTRFPPKFVPWGKMFLCFYLWQVLQDWYSHLEKTTCFLRQYGNSLSWSAESTDDTKVISFSFCFSLPSLWYLGCMECYIFYQLNIISFNVLWKYKLAKQGFLKILNFEQYWEQAAELQTRRGNNACIMGKPGQTLKSIQMVKGI